MLKIIVAEDEPLILDNIVKKLNSLDLPLQVAATAENGEDALALIAREAPDVLLTDIYMPMMDGLELIRRAQLVLPELKCIIISGYDDFSYAQKAIRLNVADYLLKPVKTPQLRQLMEKLLQEWRQRQTSREREMIVNSYAGKAHDPPSLYPDAAFDMCLICARPADPLEAVIKKLLPQTDAWWLIDEAEPDKKMLISTHQDDRLPSQLFKALEAALETVTLCHTLSPIPYGRIWDTAQALRLSMRQGMTPFHSRSIELGAAAPVCDLTTVEQQRNALLFSWGAQPTQSLSLVRAFLEALCRLTPTQAVIENQLTVLLDGLKLARHIPQALDVITHCATAEEFIERQVAFWTELVYSIPADTGTSLEAYQSIRAYLKAHFNENVTLQEVAERFHFSPEYISRLFKSVDGQPPMKYLTTLRIEEAKKLITENGYLNLRLIAELVGYPDAHYFSRIFRKITGMTPTEYKEANKF